MDEMLRIAKNGFASCVYQAVHHPTVAAFDLPTEMFDGCEPAHLSQAAFARMAAESYNGAAKFIRGIA
jgi:hypothetical protein